MNGEGKLNWMQKLALKAAFGEKKSIERPDKMKEELIKAIQELQSYVKLENEKGVELRDEDLRKISKERLSEMLNELINETRRIIR